MIYRNNVFYIIASCLFLSSCNNSSNVPDNNNDSSSGIKVYKKSCGPYEMIYEGENIPLRI